MQRLLTALTLAAACTFGAAQGAEADTYWTDITNKMNAILEESAQIYASGDEREAIDTVNEAYFRHYELLGVEHAVMSKVSGKVGRETEYTFAMLRKAMKAKKPQAEIDGYISELKETLNYQGAELDRLKVPK